MKLYVIYELNPCPSGTDYRYVQGFDRKEDAEKVLKVLEEVNIDFNYYKIIEENLIGGSQVQIGGKL